ncbi:MAG TPA: DEAD/DEAH box helicase [Vicinamibacterales bacterium]|nr:DEAD/DEAH box helicase [Vicinamibacterales bacterium]
MRLWRSWFSRGPLPAPLVPQINALRAALQGKSDDELSAAAMRAATLPEVIAVTAVTAARVLQLEMHDEQLQAAVELTAGHVVEMQTGEGKTLAAVPAIVWLARTHQGVHVLTANEYLARRDASWMRRIYERMGLSVASISQGMSAAERRAAYRADVTYATANEVGFDYLRDGLAYHADEQVHRTLSNVAVVIDEADSILIDEARIPLVIAGGSSDVSDLPIASDLAVRGLRAGRDYTVEHAGANVVLTSTGVEHVERTMGISNLFDAGHLVAHTAVQDALHAHVLLRRDVDYVVNDDAVLSVDEIKGRIVSDRRWPAGLQTALECKEGVGLRAQGRVLGSVTVEHLVALYARVCGMTGTAVTQARELHDVYGLSVIPIPTHRPMIRIDHADRLFSTRAEKDAAVIDEIRAMHGAGRPVLVGTASVEESEQLSRRLTDIPHHVLNARYEAQEAAIIARAGARGTVTISTNMAGRGVDIVLGEGVAALGGLHIIGTSRYHSRRIDHQLRGRAGRQGDPGSSQFFVSRQDALFINHADGDAAAGVDQLQRMAEGRNLDARLFLQKYERVIEAQRLAMRERREAVLTDGAATTRDVTLETLDELWSDYLAATAEMRSGTTWLSYAGTNPHASYIRAIHDMFERMTASIDEEVEARVAASGSGDGKARQRGATWTYLTSDEPFGPLTQRIMRKLLRRR